jgi:hypothetical protein
MISSDSHLALADSLCVTVTSKSLVETLTLRFLRAGRRNLKVGGVEQGVATYE